MQFAAQEMQHPSPATNFSGQLPVAYPLGQHPMIESMAHPQQWRRGNKRSHSEQEQQDIARSALTPFSQQGMPELQFDSHEQQHISLAQQLPSFPMPPLIMQSASASAAAVANKAATENATPSSSSVDDVSEGCQMNRGRRMHAQAYKRTKLAEAMGQARVRPDYVVQPDPHRSGDLPIEELQFSAQQQVQQQQAQEQFEEQQAQEQFEEQQAQEQFEEQHDQNQTSANVTQQLQEAETDIQATDHTVLQALRNVLSLIQNQAGALQQVSPSTCAIALVRRERLDNLD
jgi:hypothetical protein